LREAAINSDLVKLRRLAQLLKGSSAKIGARTMATLYEEMEGENRTNGEAAASFTKIEIEVVPVREALKAERKGCPE
jgi:glycine betaine/choline ABC-type transport system substrate-binding protein